MFSTLLFTYPTFQVYLEKQSESAFQIHRNAPVQVQRCKSSGFRLFKKVTLESFLLLILFFTKGLLHNLPATGELAEESGGRKGLQAWL